MISEFKIKELMLFQVSERFKILERFSMTDTKALKLLQVYLL